MLLLLQMLLLTHVLRHSRLLTQVLRLCGHGRHLLHNLNRRLLHLLLQHLLRLHNLSQAALQDRLLRLLIVDGVRWQRPHVGAGHVVHRLLLLLLLLGGGDVVRMAAMRMHEALGRLLRRRPAHALHHVLQDGLRAAHAIVLLGRAWLGAGRHVRWHPLRPRQLHARSRSAWYERQTASARLLHAAWRRRRAWRLLLHGSGRRGLLSGPHHVLLLLWRRLRLLLLRRRLLLLL